MTLTMQSLQNHGKEINMEIFYVEAKKTRLISHEYCRVISFSAFFPLFLASFPFFMLEHLATLHKSSARLIDYIHNSR